MRTHTRCSLNAHTMQIFVPFHPASLSTTTATTATHAVLLHWGFGTILRWLSELYVDRRFYFRAFICFNHLQFKMVQMSLQGTCNSYQLFSNTFNRGCCFINPGAIFFLTDKSKKVRISFSDLLEPASAHRLLHLQLYTLSSDGALTEGFSSLGYDAFQSRNSEESLVRVSTWPWVKWVIYGCEFVEITKSPKHKL